MALTQSRRPARARTPLHLWIVGILAVVWNSFGAFDYLMTQLEAEWYLANYTPEQLEYFANYPAWAVALWAIGVWFAVGGSVALLLRSRFAAHLFGISLFGLAGTTVFTNFISDGAGAMESGASYVVFSIVLWLVLIGLLIYAVTMHRRGVLR